MNYQQDNISELCLMKSYQDIREENRVLKKAYEAQKMSSIFCRKHRDEILLECDSLKRRNEELENICHRLEEKYKDFKDINSTDGLVILEIYFRNKLADHCAKFEELMRLISILNKEFTEDRNKCREIIEKSSKKDSVGPFLEQVISLSDLSGLQERLLSLCEKREVFNEEIETYGFGDDQCVKENQIISSLWEETKKCNAQYMEVNNAIKENNEIVKELAEIHKIIYGIDDQ